MSQRQIHLVNGPNLNLLGRRQPEIYGRQSFDDYFEALELKYRREGLQLFYFQSNHEGDLIDYLQQIGYAQEVLGIVINAGGYTHTSVALADALAAIETPAVEVHLSNIHAREPFRHHSYLAPQCKGQITGLGLQGYELAILYLLELEANREALPDPLAELQEEDYTDEEEEEDDED
jgi:3-dehydroquinate dehydratase-2